MGQQHCVAISRPIFLLSRSVESIFFDRRVRKNYLSGSQKTGGIPPTLVGVAPKAIFSLFRLAAVCCLCNQL